MATIEQKDYTEIRIPVPWGHMAGRWYGDQQVRPILALHGWLDNCGTFAKLAPLLQSHASLLCLDLPGHGYSSHLPAGILYYNMEYVRAILRLMYSYKWDKVSLMGHSMGGSVAFHFAALQPDRVDIIIGLDIVKTAHVAASVVPQYVAHIMEKALIDTERVLNESPMSEPPSYSFEECERLLYEGSQHSVSLENCKYILERNVSKSQKYPDKYYFSRDGRIKYMGELNPNAAMSTEMAMRICRVSTPYLVIKGGASTNISARSKEVIDVLQENNPNFAMHEIPGGTHHLHLNNPEPVVELIIAFLKKYRPIEDVRNEGNGKQIKGKL